MFHCVVWGTKTVGGKQKKRRVLNLTTNTVRGTSTVFLYQHLSKTLSLLVRNGATKNSRARSHVTVTPPSAERNNQSAPNVWRAERKNQSAPNVWRAARRSPRVTERHALGTILFFLFFVFDIWYNPTGTFWSGKGISSGICAVFCTFLVYTYSAWPHLSPLGTKLRTVLIDHPTM